MERLEGYAAALIVDAVDTGTHKLGEVFCFELDDLPPEGAGYSSAAHDTSLQRAVEMGRTLGIALPETIQILGIEIQNQYDFCESLSPAVEAALPRAVEMALEMMKDLIHEQLHKDR